jgi:hypothetical protein
MKILQFLLANYNSSDHIEILIKSLRTYPPPVSYEILACDNGSTDGSAERLQSFPEVQMWKLHERLRDNTVKKRQEALIRDFKIKKYLHRFFAKRIRYRDYRQSHASALNYLLAQVTSPLCATLDTDVEFLNPFWLEPFLRPLLINPETAAVGLLQEGASFRIQGFVGRTHERLHPCLALYRTRDLREAGATFDANDWFDLQLPLIHKCLEERLSIKVTLGDVGHQVHAALKRRRKRVECLTPAIFSTHIRHFGGATVKKEILDPDLLDWREGIKSKPHLKSLDEHADREFHYVLANQKTLELRARYWRARHPAPPWRVYSTSARLAA